MNLLDIIGRTRALFEQDIESNEKLLGELLKNSKILVIGGAGSIGQAVSLELFNRSPKSLHIVDVSENNMVELVRSIRSSFGYGVDDFRTFAIDCGSLEFSVFCKEQGPYDYVFNLSAMKHVRSEKDPYTLMRLIKVNIFNTIDSLRLTSSKSCKNYFCVSTDKAANPVNMMGASKRIMEYFLMRESIEQNVSMARFANVAFSDGSLLHGFNQRFSKQQPISAPLDVKRYFLTPEESGELCLMSGLLGSNREIFFPKLKEELHLETLSDVAIRFLSARGYEAVSCLSEEEARDRAKELIPRKKWPVYFFQSDTTGEKDFEEFFTDKEDLDLSKFRDVGVIKNAAEFCSEKLIDFENEIEKLRSSGSWQRKDLINLFNKVIPEFLHKETGKYLDNRM